MCGHEGAYILVYVILLNSDSDLVRNSLEFDLIRGTRVVNYVKNKNKQNQDKEGQLREQASGNVQVAIALSSLQAQ